MLMSLKIKFENNKESCFSSIDDLFDLTNQEKPGVLKNGAEVTNVTCVNLNHTFLITAYR